MSDLFSIGSSALLAYRQALDITGQNIANANTPGYVRRSPELQSRGGQSGGVIISDIKRNTDAVATSRLLGDNAAYARLDTFNNLATRLDALLSNDDAGLGKPLQAFYTSLNGLAASPTSTAARQVVLGAAQTVGGRLAELGGELEAQSADLNTRTQQAVAEINQYAGAIAQINQRLAAKPAGEAPDPNLLDQRDQLVNEISSRVGVSTVTQGDGTLNVYLGSGQALVLAQKSYALGVAPDRYGSGTLDITYGSSVLTAQLSGGTLGGLQDYRREMLEPALNQLGRVTAGLVQSVNAQHAQGMDAYGNAGGNFFQPLSAEALGATTNGGNASVQMSISDAAQLGSGDLLLRYNGSSWSLSDRRSGQSVTLTGSGTPSDPFTGAGLSFTVDGSAVAGDEFLMQPLRAAAGGLQLAISDPQALAAAALPVSGGVAGSSDNSNARALANLGSRGVLDGGRTSISSAYTGLVTQTGTRAQGVQMSRDAASAIRDQTLAVLDDSAGVNLDEEAANLVRWQQAYQAAAQVMATANELFDSLLAATRR